MYARSFIVRFILPHLRPHQPPATYYGVPLFMSRTSTLRQREKCAKLPAPPTSPPRPKTNGIVNVELDTTIVTKISITADAFMSAAVLTVRIRHVNCGSEICQDSKFAVFSSTAARI